MSWIRYSHYWRRMETIRAVAFPYCLPLQISQIRVQSQWNKPICFMPKSNSLKHLMKCALLQWCHWNSLQQGIHMDLSRWNSKRNIYNLIGRDYHKVDLWIKSTQITNLNCGSFFLLQMLFTNTCFFPVRLVLYILEKILINLELHLYYFYTEFHCLLEGVFLTKDIKYSKHSFKIFYEYSDSKFEL